MALAFGAYLLQVGTPLRIEYDSTEYLLLAAHISDGDGFPAAAPFPPGLPYLVAGLDAVGAARSWGIVLLNAAFLALGLGAWAWILRRRLGYPAAGVLAATVVCLLAVPMIRYASHPMSEATFFGASLVALALASEANARRSAALLAAAAAAAGLAISIRSFGIALAPALLPALGGIAGTRARRLAVLAAGIALAAVALVVLSPTRYVDEALDEWGDRPLHVAAVHAANLLGGYAELFVNVPLDHAPAVLDHVYTALGVVLVPLVAVGAVALRRRDSVVVVYLASTFALLAAWPLDASRLILPVFPLLLACAVAAAGRWGRPAHVALGLWGSAFAVVGIVVFVSVTRTSYAGDRFPDRYSDGNPAMRSTYRVAFGTDVPGDVDGVLPRSLWALRRYESRAIGAPGPLPPVSSRDPAR